VSLSYAYLLLIFIYVSWDSDSLRAGQSADRIPVGVRSNRYSQTDTAVCLLASKQTAVSV